jgi:hypothetical protein
MVLSSATSGVQNFVAVIWVVFCRCAWQDLLGNGPAYKGENPASWFSRYIGPERPTPGTGATRGPFYNWRQVRSVVNEVLRSIQPLQPTPPLGLFGMDSSPCGAAELGRSTALRCPVDSKFGDAMPAFSPAVRAWLEPAGWFPDRVVDISCAAQLLKARGIPVAEAASRFLREFNDLKIDTPRGPFYFDINDFLLHLGDTDIPYLSRITNEPLCPVGHGLFLWLLISPKSDFVLLDNHWRRYYCCQDLRETFELLFVPGSPKVSFVEMGSECWPPGYRLVDE